MTYLLDTNVISHLIKGTAPALEMRFADMSPRDVAISAITWAELRQGVKLATRRRAAELEDDLDRLAAELPILAFDLAAADAAGTLLATLRRKGTPIGAYDVLIAGHALALGSILVTNNTREFKRVPGLRVEDWTQPEA